MSNNTGKWLPFDLDGNLHKCPIEKSSKSKVNELIELVDLEERMEHAATICTEIRSKMSELEIVISGAGK